MNRTDLDVQVEVAESEEGSRSSSQPLISRRAAIRGALGGAFVTLLARPELAMARDRHNDGPALGLLLRGRYEAVVDAPDLGLSAVELNDGSYSKTRIYPAFGVPHHTNGLKHIGDFYVQEGNPGDLCAYDLPDGAIAMRFGPSHGPYVPDGSGGQYWQGFAELKVLEATGSYRSFVGGHNHMVDDLHLLASGEADEFCICLISRP